jgi:hypothetical protein
MKVGDLVKFKNPAICDRIYLVVKTDADRMGGGGLLQKVWIYPDPRLPDRSALGNFYDSGYYFRLDLEVLNESR